MPLLDLRTFLERAEAIGELKKVNGADTNLEIGAIAELALHHHGPALLFDDIPNYEPGYRVASNVCSSTRRGLLAIGMDPDLSEDEAMARFQQRWDQYRPVAPVEVDSSPLLENVQTGDDVNLLQFPVPLWHELDGGPYIGTGLAVINQDPDTGFVNVGCYRVQLHDAKTTGMFSEPGSDGRRIMEKYWKQGKAAPVAISFAPEPLVFLSACSVSGAPKSSPEYEYTGFLAGEPVKVIRGNVTGLPISAGSEIAIEGEIPAPGVESRVEGPFGEWTGYYEAASTPEPVIHVKALYYRNNPILYGAPPFKHTEHYAFPLHLRQVTGLMARLAQLEIPVRKIGDLRPLGATVFALEHLRPLGATVFALEQQHPDDVTRLMDELDKSHSTSRMLIVVDHDVNPNDPYDVLWALGTRFDPELARTSVIQNHWLLDPLRTMEDRISREPRPYKRLILNGCRPFDRLRTFPPVNKFSQARREDVWDKWRMADWLPPGSFA